MKRYVIWAGLLVAVCGYGWAADQADLKTHQELLKEIAPQIRPIDTDGLKQLLDHNPNVVLVDVRTPDEVASMGHIDAKQQVVIPRGWLEVKIFNHVIDKDTPIVTYCGAGLRSAFAAYTLQQMGFTDVHNYAAGYLEWEQRGLPVVKGK